ncbi:50S ribosomal protein L21 [Candidatus Acetothermia bacterium]|nr:MAG: 50S ribosomal protein L21 [Candidatus Acetothermia bacterium]HHK67284.1 50S ribosomal protein L21 [Candidatus Acetothermia bacterium]
MYAVIETGGKQYRVEEGMLLKHERLNGVKPGEDIVFDKVLLVVKDEEVRVGTPYLDGVKVKGEIRTEGRDDKILVYKYKSKKGYRRSKGHRQPFMTTEIKAIEG